MAIGAGIIALGLQATAAVAQSVTPGKYTGRVDFMVAGNAVGQTAELTIVKVEGDRIEGVAWVGVTFCRVDTPVTGRIEGDVLKVRGKAVKENCGVSWDLKMADDVLEGTTSRGNAIRMSK
jgi:hypothetical protein